MWPELLPDTVSVAGNLFGVFETYSIECREGFSLFVVC